jgi:hypothetical protein
VKHYIGVSIVLLASALALAMVIRQCEQSTRRQLGAIKNSVAQVLKVEPEVRINQKIIFAQTSPIAELAVVTREQLVEYTFTQNQRFLGGTVPQTGKKISAQAVYRLKAGFDLTQPFVVQLDPTTGKITASLPAAKILSIEAVGAPELKEERDLLTSITPEERQAVLRGLDEAARATAAQSGLTREADVQARQRLEEIFARNGQKVTITQPGWLE